MRGFVVGTAWAGTTLWSGSMRRSHCIRRCARRAPKSASMSATRTRARAHRNTHTRICTNRNMPALTHAHRYECYKSSKMKDVQFTMCRRCYQQQLFPDDLMSGSLEFVRRLAPPCCGNIIQSRQQATCNRHRATCNTSSWCLFWRSASPTVLCAWRAVFACVCFARARACLIWCARVCLIWCARARVLYGARACV